MSAAELMLKAERSLKLEDLDLCARKLSPKKIATLP